MSSILNPDSYHEEDIFHCAEVFLLQHCGYPKPAMKKRAVVFKLDKVHGGFVIRSKMQTVESFEDFVYRIIPDDNVCRVYFCEVDYESARKSDQIEARFYVTIMFMPEGCDQKMVDFWQSYFKMELQTRDVLKATKKEALIGTIACHLELNESRGTLVQFEGKKYDPFKLHPGLL